MYFKTLPTLRYPSFLSDKNSSLDYVDAKNLFRRVKLREDIQNILTLFASLLKFQRGYFGRKF